VRKEYMSETIKNLVKKTWVDYFSGNEEVLKEIDPNILNEYKEAMVRLETDFDLQAELGIGGY
jgi:methyl coenzyme M reductase alpha subunit